MSKINEKDAQKIICSCIPLCDHKVEITKPVKSYEEVVNVDINQRVFVFTLMWMHKDNMSI